MSEHDESRNIPEEVRRSLRGEVNYGCPVPNCWDPLLTFHHFDPPFQEGHSHDPSGMIALCRKHHDAADAKRRDRGLYSVEQLRRFKTNPWVTDRLSTKLLELPPRFVLFAGGTEVRSSSVMVDVGGVPVLWLRSAANSASLDLIMGDRDGRAVVAIERDALTAYTESLRDADFSPKSYDWKIETTDSGRVSIRFRRLLREHLIEHLVREWSTSFAEFLPQLQGLAHFRAVSADRHAHLAATIRVDSLADSRDEDGTYGVIELRMRVPVADANGVNAWLRIEPWTADIEFPAGVTSLTFDYGSPLTIARPKHGFIVPLYRLNPFAMSVTDQAVCSAFSAKTAGDSEGSAARFWSEARLELATRSRSCGHSERGLAHLNAARPLANLAETKAAICIAYNSLGEHAAAEEMHAEVVAGDPDHPTARLLSCLHLIATRARREEILEAVRDLIGSRFSAPILRRELAELRQWYEQATGVVLPSPTTGPWSVAPRVMFNSDELLLGGEVTIVDLPGIGNRIQWARR